MLTIACPHCGPRSQNEFTYGGDASVARPPEDAPTAAWFAYVYERRNPKGLHEEFWQHSAGCRTWLRVTRDTRTHDVLAVRQA
jgi:methylglutamate dehydrogenase subunit B